MKTPEFRGFRFYGLCCLEVTGPLTLKHQCRITHLKMSTGMIQEGYVIITYEQDQQGLDQVFQTYIHTLI